MKVYDTVGVGAAGMSCATRIAKLFSDFFPRLCSKARPKKPKIVSEMKESTSDSAQEGNVATESKVQRKTSSKRRDIGLTSRCRLYLKRKHLLFA